MTSINEFGFSRFLIGSYSILWNYKTIKMKLLPPGYNTKDLEKGVKNKWRWEWLNERDSRGEKWAEWLRKPDAMGVAFCDYCSKTINYKSNGKKALRLHAEDENHKKNSRTVKSNQVLPGSSKAKPEMESMQDRVAKQRAITAAFISEHCLPFSIAEDLLKFAKRLSEDKQALQKTTISKSSATYINTHGVAKSFKQEVAEKVKGKMVSLNLDEATNNNNDKILNILIQFYDDEEGQIVLRHLGSRKQNLATAKNIMESIESILEEYEIEWWQVLSMLMDNCSTMRGVRGGVEALARERNPSMLDISGDSVHMINNAVKALLSNLDSGIQSLCSDLFYDIEESPKVRHIFNELQSLLNLPTAKHLIRPISSRFLQMLDVSTRVIELFDPLTVYYYSFLSEEEKTKYRTVISNILTENKVSDEAQAAIVLMQISQETQQKSSTSNDRKDRIVDCLFQNRRETKVMLNTFRGILGVFQGYVKVFQSEKPLIHTLHSRMLDVTRQLLGMFVKPENIPDRVSKLVKLDVADRDIQKPDRDLGVGKFAHVDMNKARIDKSCQHWVTKFYSKLRTGYVLAAKKMLQMPLNNHTIRQMSVLDPELVGHSQVEETIRNLGKKLPRLFSEEELGALSGEAARYNVDQQVQDLESLYKEDDRVDSGFWVKVFSLKDFSEIRYPAVKKLVTALLTVFSGPLIESTFNIMDDIVEKDRTKMTIVNYEAVAIIKTTLRKKNVKSTDLKVSTSMKKACISAYDTYQQYLKKMKEEKKKQHDEVLNTSVQMLKLERAKKIAKLVKLKNRLAAKGKDSYRRSSNRKLDTSSCLSAGRSWKRIKNIVE